MAYWAAGLAAVAAITGAIGSLGGPALTIGAFLGIAVPIVAAAVQSWNSASGDSDKVAAYTTAKEALDRILVQEVDAVREQAARGDRRGGPGVFRQGASGHDDGARRLEGHRREAAEARARLSRRPGFSGLLVSSASSAFAAGLR